MTAGPQDTPPTARDRLADAACEAAFHWHLDRENPSWRELWYRVVDAIADAALAQAREGVLGPFRELAEEEAEAAARARKHKSEARRWSFAARDYWAIEARVRQESADRIRRAVEEAS